MNMPAGNDELELWDALVQGEKPRYAGDRLGIPRNRIRYICEKWTRKRWYGYGVVYDLGWIEGRGPIRETANKENEQHGNRSEDDRAGENRLEIVSTTGYREAQGTGIRKVDYLEFEVGEAEGSVPGEDSHGHEHRPVRAAGGPQRSARGQLRKQRPHHVERARARIAAGIGLLAFVVVVTAFTGVLSVVGRDSAENTMGWTFLVFFAACAFAAFVWKET